MLYFNFKNYEEFKTLFGKRVGNNGKNIRSNGILLSFLKHEFKCKRFYNLCVCSVSEAVTIITREIVQFSGFSACGMDDGEHYFYSTDYCLDDRRGVCEDGDTVCVRYIRRDNGKVYKMKAGKIMRNVLESCKLTEKYCKQILVYYCELFAEEWHAHVESNYGDGLELHVNDNFCDIYDGYCLKGDFHSCMTGEDQYSFYEDSVKAKAAYLTNPDGDIVARCIIFTEVHNKNSGEVYRLAERQYSSEQDNMLKRILVDKLIQAGEIDGYKEVGVDCHSPRKFVLNDGTTLYNEKLWIECELDDGDTISYQDSFKWFDYDRQRADNYGSGCEDLSTTEPRFRYGEYDDYHDYHCRETQTVHVWNSSCGYYNEFQCDVDNMGDFRRCERYSEYYDEADYSDYDHDYIPCDEAVYSKQLGTYLWRDLATWCSEADDYFPDDDYERCFEKWKGENWEYDEVYDEYVEETVSCNIWNVSTQEYEEKKSEKSYVEYNFHEYEGEWYDMVNEDGIPFHLVEELEEAVV